MRAVVTGGAGFIGSNLVDALVGRGDSVAVVDNLSTGRRSNLAAAMRAGATLHEVDIADAEALGAVIVDYRPDVVFHLAAQIDVRRSVADPDWDAEVNVRGMINTLEAARRAGVERIVYSSTGGAIYGEAGVHPTPETSPQRPLAPYGQSKYAAEGYCSLYQRLHGLSSVILRYANVYGPRQDPLGEGGVIAIFCGHLKAGTRPTVFGDGTQTRDYTYVGDVVAANLLAGETDRTGCFNIGTGRETSVLDLVHAMEPMADSGSFVPTFAPARQGEVLRSVLDSTLGSAELGWQPEVDLREGLRRTLRSLDFPAGERWRAARTGSPRRRAA
jgi:UDP-glucose 4-epimerase